MPLRTRTLLWRHVALLSTAGFALAGFPSGAAAAPPACDPDDAGLELPDGFCALVVADAVSGARDLVVSAIGDVYVATQAEERGVVGLRDTDGDGRADERIRFGEHRGTGIALHDSHLYFAWDGGVVRYPLEPGRLGPSGPAETIVEGLPGPRTSHAAKTAVIDAAGHLYVNIGAPSNSCQETDRAPGSPGLDPCPELAHRGGIWRFDAGRVGQRQRDGVRFATGLRNTFALDLEPNRGVVFGVQHGRDQLGANWSALFSVEDQAEKPAEELVEIREGDDFGWPYCYYDPAQERKVLAPEYGGDGRLAGRCSAKKSPALALPAHWGPNALVFYEGLQFPVRYRGGAFIAFHGSWNRAPLPQGGYNVVFAPFASGVPVGSWEVFADGFAGEDVSPRGAAYRPSGLAVGPDGSLYVSADRGGRIWRILYRRP